jgi:hypothetical protein
MCDHKNYIEVGAKTSDMCSVSLRDQKESNDKNLQHQKYQTYYGDKCESATLVSYHGYCPSISGIGSGDYLAIRICIACKQVLHFPNWTKEEWVANLTPAPWIDEDFIEEDDLLEESEKAREE